MTEEEYFRKNYSDSCYGDKPLSPYWDFFQDGVEFGERQSEKKIEELKKQLDLKEKALSKAKKETKRIADRVNKDKRRLIRRKAELKEELKKWKDEWQEQVQKATDEGYARTLQTMQLTNAKEIIREFVEWATWQGSNCPNFKSIQDKAEQFLNEVEK